MGQTYYSRIEGFQMRTSICAWTVVYYGLPMHLVGWLDEEGMPMDGCIQYATAIEAEHAAIALAKQYGLDPIMDELLYEEDR